MGVLKQLNGDKYSVIEVNFLAARRTGAVKAQLPLSTTDFSQDLKAENGMLLTYNPLDGGGAVNLPGNANADKVLLHFSVEKEYDSLRPGLRNFALAPGEFYPRLYDVAVRDTWTTDAVLLDGADDHDIQSAYDALTPNRTTVYAVRTTAVPGLPAGFIDIAAGDNISAIVGVYVIGKTTLPNGGLAVKVEVARSY